MINPVIRSRQIHRMNFIDCITDHFFGSTGFESLFNSIKLGGP